MTDQIDKKQAELGSPEIFRQFEQLVAEENGQRALVCLAEYLFSQARFHELFEVRKLQLRLECGWPLRSGEIRRELQPREQLDYDAKLLEICREIGMALWHEGRLSEAWMYLQAIDDRGLLSRLLRATEINEDNADDLLGLAIQEGIDPTQGIEWLLTQRGTCNAITTYDSYYFAFDLETRRESAAILVRHLHAELRNNLLVHLRRLEVKLAFEPVAEAHPISQLLQWNANIFDQGMVHVDVSHLAAVVRLGRIVNDPAAIRDAVELCAYGKAIASDFRPTGDSPFVDLFEDSGLYYRALLGEEIEKGINFFRDRAEACQPAVDTTAPIEWYLYFLQQLGRRELAIDETIRLLPNATPQMNIAPTLHELSETRADWEKAQRCFARHQRLLDFSICVLENAISEASE
ncbi:MAG TPA: hypothetical protein PKD64_06695 [Pirellulaceae bacterium]|nr:hypothetical protein [Pirellulaceae bacterium]HMO91871.1 hypothetical protein [Pirellulaceae bacterium]HMP69719.1 hypothetical protein [Pirellulaceae bacterium]